MRIVRPDVAIDDSALRDDLLALTPKRAVALRHEGEWSTHSTALQGGPGAAGMSGGRSRSSTKRMVSGAPAKAFPSASVKGKDAQRLSVSATAVRYDTRSVSEGFLD